MPRLDASPRLRPQILPRWKMAKKAGPSLTQPGCRIANRNPVPFRVRVGPHD